MTMRSNVETGEEEEVVASLTDDKCWIVAPSYLEEIGTFGEVIMGSYCRRIGKCIDCSVGR